MKENTALKQFILRSGAVIVIITLLTYGTIYQYISNEYRKLFEEEITLATGLITKAIESRQVATAKLEKEIDQKLYMISKGIAKELAGTPVREISRQDLKALAEEWGVSGISLFVKRGNDIVIAQSSDKEEIGLSTKKWGYWNTAFQQLMSSGMVSVPKGFATKNFWVGPVSKSEWDASKFFKYAYYYDNTTEYMINPYVQSENIERLIYFTGIAQLITELNKQYRDIEEISIINGPAWLKGRNNRIIEPQTDLPILYGLNNFYLPKDREYISNLLQTNEEQSQTFLQNNLLLRKHYIPLPDQRVLIIVQNEKRLDKTILNLNLFFITLLMISGVAMVVILRRITRKQILMLDMERKRLELAEQFKHTMDTLPNLLFKCKRNEQGKVSLTYLEGASLVKMGGQPLMDQQELPYELLLPLMKRYEKELLQAFRGETVKFEINVGEEFYQVIVKPIHEDQCTAVTGIAGYATEITDRVRLEKELEVARDEAMQLSHAKSTFLAMMSHELRTPLHSSTGMLELLADTPLTAVQRQYLQTAQTAGKSLLLLINDLLDLTRLEVGKITLSKQVFNISDFMEETVQLLSVLAMKKGLTLSYSVSSSVPPAVVGDMDRLRQILMNLVENAIKFTEAGNVSINLEKSFETAEGISLMFTIRDTGIGIARKHIETIFQQFSQADSSISRKFGGSGLGLTISKHLIERMGGNIWVESVLGVGSTFFFTVTFGVPAESFIPQSMEDETIPQFEISSINILLVDDSVENRNLIKAYMSKVPVLIDEAEEGGRAVELFQTKRYDLVLMDIQMPIMDGFQATRSIRNWETDHDLQPTPIIALTANVLQEDIERSLEAGCTTHLSKPITKQAFYSCVMQYVPLKYSN